MERFSVVGAFDEFVADLRSFHHAGVAAEDADRVGATSDLNESFSVYFVCPVRGESLRR